jgi:hypothetical protein
MPSTPTSSLQRVQPRSVIRATKFWSLPRMSVISFVTALTILDDDRLILWSYGDWGFFPYERGNHFDEINQTLSSWSMQETKAYRMSTLAVFL